MNQHPLLYNSRILYVGSNEEDRDGILEEFTKLGINGVTYTASHLDSLGKVKESVRPARPYHFVVYDLAQPEGKFSPFYMYCRCLKELKKLPFVLLTVNNDLPTFLDEEDMNLFTFTEKLPGMNNLVQGIVELLEMSYKGNYPSGIQNIEYKDKGDYQIMILPPSIDRSVIDEMVKNLDFLAQGRIKFSTIDFTKVETLPVAMGRGIFGVIRDMKKALFKYYSTNVNSSVSSALSAAGLKEAFNIKGSLEEILKLENTGGVQKVEKDKLITFDVNFINPFLIGVSTYFIKGLNVPIKAGRPAICRELPAADQDWVLLTLLKTPHFSFGVRLSFNKKFFPAIVTRLSADQARTENFFYNDLQMGIFELSVSELRKNKKFDHYEEANFKMISGAGKDDAGSSVGIKINFTSEIGEFSMIINGQSQ